MTNYYTPSITATILETVLGTEDRTLDAIELLNDTSSILYTEEDVLAEQDVLQRIFKKVCVERKLTQKQLNYYLMKYWLSQGYSQDQATSKVNNDLSHLKRGQRFTYVRFQDMMAVLDRPVLSLTVLCPTPTGEMVEYNSD